MKMFILRQVVLLSCFCVAGAEAKRTVILEIHTTERDYQPAQLYVEQHLRTVEPGGVVRIDVEDSASMVHVRTVDGKVAVMFPVNGAVPLPAAEGARAQILVGRSPDEVLLTPSDREQRPLGSQSSFSPPPPTQTDSLCWEANVITFRNSNVLGSTNKFNIGNPTFTFENGWMDLSFTIPAASLSYVYHQLGGGSTTQIQLSNGSSNYYSSATYYGLPVIGFAAITFSNGAVNGLASNYGGNFNHKATRWVQPY